MMDMILIDQFSLLFLILAPALVLFIIGLILFMKMGPQARKLGKANMLKRATLIVGSETGAIDIKVGKHVSSGHIEVAKTECYEILQTKETPELNRKYFWKGTGIPVTIGVTRKSVVVSPSVLIAASLCDNTTAKKNLPKEFKEWADNVGVTIPTEVEESDESEGAEKGKTKKVTKRVYTKLLELEPLMLLWYLRESMDSDAQDVLLDMKYQQGLKDAGKQWMKLGLAIGVCLIIGLSIFGVILVSGGALGGV
jgi:hypothetical protein